MFWRISIMALVAAATLLTGCTSTTLGNVQGRHHISMLPPKPDEGPDGGGWTKNLTPIPPGVPEGKSQRWQPIYFAYDQSTIGDSERPKLDKIFEFLSENREFDLLIEGHCDERGSEEYNRALGERRALAVRNYLVDRGLSATRLETLSFGEERPAKEGKSEEAFRMNRRAELVVLPPKSAAAAK